MNRPRRAANEYRMWQRADYALLRHYAATHSAAQIGKMLGRTAKAVFAVAARLDLSLGSVGRPSKYGDDTVREVLRRYYVDKQGVTSIAAEMDIPKSNVSRWISGQRCGHLLSEFVGT